jgi:hypothetical protein
MLLVVLLALRIQAQPGRVFNPNITVYPRRNKK